MSAKQKTIIEDASINFRLSPELKEWITNEAKKENKSISNYLRDHFESYKKGDLYTEEVDYYKNTSFINSTSFLQLIAFVFSKRNNESCTASTKQMNDYISTIKQLPNENIPEDIITEFDKVLMDLIRVKNTGSAIIMTTFQFCKSSFTEPGFNYDLLEKYLLVDLKAYTIIKIS